VLLDDTLELDELLDDELLDCDDWVELDELLWLLLLVVPL
jgi:hypothetical protein